MLRFGGRRRRRLPIASEINITNLVDVAFVLLIIFIITAPILQGGIEVQLPEADSAPIDAADAVIVTIAQDGAIAVSDAPITSLDELEGIVKTYVGEEGDARPVQMKVDRRVNWEVMAQVLGVLNRIGVKQIGLPVEPPPRTNR